MQIQAWHGVLIVPLLIMAGCSSAGKETTSEAAPVAESAPPSTSMDPPTSSPATAPSSPEPAEDPTTEPAEQVPAWVGCDDAQWALEGEDDQGTLVYAMCGDTFRSGSNDSEWSTWETIEGTEYGGEFLVDDGTRMVMINDARDDTTIAPMTTNGNATVTRWFEVSRRYIRGADDGSGDDSGEVNADGTSGGDSDDPDDWGSGPGFIGPIRADEPLDDLVDAGWMVEEPDAQDCAPPFELTPELQDAGLVIGYGEGDPEVLDGVTARYGRFPTAEGIGIGSSESDLLDAYDDLVETSYDRPWDPMTGHLRETGDGSIFFQTGETPGDSTGEVIGIAVWGTDTDEPVLWGC